MLLVGIDAVPDAAQGTQLALYSILAVPLIMGNDLRVLSDNAKKLLLNKDVVAISQDPAGRAGTVVTCSLCSPRVFMFSVLNMSVQWQLYFTILASLSPFSLVWHSIATVF